MKSRLLDGELGDVERALLSSADDDAPSAAARARTLAALGAGAATVLGTHAAQGAIGAAGASTSAVAGTVAAGKAGGAVTAGFVAKWLAVGLTAGAVTAGTLAVVSAPLVRPAAEAHSPASAPASAREASRIGRYAAAPEAPPAPEAVVPETLPGADALERARAVDRRARPLPMAAPEERGAGTSPAAVPSEGSSALVEEVASLDRVRAALAAGDPNGALARLSAHHRAFPSGALEPEAVVLEVRALVQLGRRGEASRVASRFLAGHPGSPQAARLESLVGAAPR